MMEWKDDALEEEGLQDDAFIVIHGPPSAPTAAPKHRAAAAVAAAEATRVLQLAAFPELFEGEPPEQRLARAVGADKCLQALKQQIEDALACTDAEVFKRLQEFAQASHHPPTPRPASLPEFAGRQRLPTALVLAGGVNSADHCRTFPNLVAFLRDRGCYVALLHPHSVGKVPGDAIGEILRQLSGLSASKAEHMAALVQWYQDETGAEKLAVEAAAAAAASERWVAGAAAASPAGAAVGSSASACINSSGKKKKEKQEARQLRQRLPSATQTASMAQLANRRRPLVVILEGTEGVDVQCLRDFILTVSEAYQDVPLTLVLGLTTSADALHALLPSEITDRCMELHHFKLASAMTRLNSLVQQVLLGGGGRWPGLLFSAAIIDKLAVSFFNHYYSAGCITQGLQVAALNHFLTQPLSFLAVAAAEGGEAVEEACAALDPAMLAEARCKLDGGSPAQLAAAVMSAREGWSRWAVGVHWLVVVAEAVELKGFDIKPWKLAEEAMRPGFAAKQLKQLLTRIEPPLRKLPPAAVQQLAAQLQQRAEAVCDGAEAAAEQLEQLVPFVTGEEDTPDDEQQQQQQLATSRQQRAATAASTAAEEGNGKQKRARREVYHSKTSRNAALLHKSAQQAAAKGGGWATATDAQERSKVANESGARFAAWLSPALRDLLTILPTNLPGADVFTCRDAGALDCLTAEPRSALHLALTEPNHFLSGLPADLGFTSAQEDAVLVYSIFDQDPKCANLADWYQAFAAVHSAAAGEQQEGATGGSCDGSSRKRKATVKKARKKEKGGAAGGSGADGGGAAGGSGADGGGAEGQRQEAEEKWRLRELAARFSQATAELQYVGLIKPTKKRRGDWVQRLVHQPARE